VRENDPVLKRQREAAILSSQQRKEKGFSREGRQRKCLKISARVRKINAWRSEKKTGHGVKLRNKKGKRSGKEKQGSGVDCLLWGRRVWTGIGGVVK